MRRLFSVSFCFLVTNLASADEAAAKKRMPKEQLSHYEAIEKLRQANRDANEEKNGLKQSEMRQKVKADFKSLQATMTREAQKSGLKGWVGTVVTKARDPELTGPALTIHTRNILIHVYYAGLPENVKAAVRDLKDGTLVMVDVEPDNRIQFSPVASGFDVKIIASGVLLKSIRKTSDK